MKLKDWLKSNNLTQREFGERIQRNRITVWRLCNDLNTPDKDTVQAIVAATGGEVGPRDLLTWLDGAGEASA